LDVDRKTVAKYVRAVEFYGEGRNLLKTAFRLSRP
jgi:hypothetical protein